MTYFEDNLIDSEARWFSGCITIGSSLPFSLLCEVIILRRSATDSGVVILRKFRLGPGYYDFAMAAMMAATTGILDRQRTPLELYIANKDKARYIRRFFPDVATSVRLSYETFGVLKTLLSFTTKDSAEGYTEAVTAVSRRLFQTRLLASIEYFRPVSRLLTFDDDGSMDDKQARTIVTDLWRGTLITKEFSPADYDMYMRMWHNEPVVK